MFTVHLDTRALEKAIDFQRATIRRSLYRGLNAGGDKVRTQVQRALKEQTGVRLYRSITSRVRTRRAHEGFPQYWILIKGKPIPIEEFPLAITARGIDAKPWGVDHLFVRSFQQKFKGGLRVRTERRGRFPIRPILGPSLAKEVMKGAIPDVFYAAVARDVVPTITMALLRKA